MKAPDFWQHGGWQARLLAPLSAAYGMAGFVRRALVRPFDCGVPVVCVGNFVAGGAGKTPVAISILKLLAERGRLPHALTRGYGGRLSGPVQVSPDAHDADAVGDEALLLARVAPTWVARARPVGAGAAVANGAKAIVMDDGFQNPTLLKTLSLLVIDGPYGLGNGRVLPAGPLREPLDAALQRANAVVLIGEARQGLVSVLEKRVPVLRAELLPGDDGESLRGARVLAFAGIGRPEKFFDSLRCLGVELVGARSFADHHRYHDGEIVALKQEAERLEARLVTTEKDYVRLTPALTESVETLSVSIKWNDEAAILEVLGSVMA